MLTLLAVLGVLGVFFVAAVVATREGDVLVDAPPDGSPAGTLPAGPLLPGDVAALRFGLAVRGYRMAEVDEALDRLQDALAERDERLAALEAEVADLAGVLAEQDEAVGVFLTGGTFPEPGTAGTRDTVDTEFGDAFDEFDEDDLVDGDDLDDDLDDDEPDLPQPAPESWRANEHPAPALLSVPSADLLAPVVQAPLPIDVPEPAPAADPPVAQADTFDLWLPPVPAPDADAAHLPEARDDEEPQGPTGPVPPTPPVPPVWGPSAGGTPPQP